MANKTVMKLHMNDCNKCKKVALHSVTNIEGIDSLTINIKENTLTLIGDADPVCVSNILRKKFRCAQLISFGPVSGGEGGKGGGEGGKGGGGGGKAGGAEAGKGGEGGAGKGGGGGKGGEGKGGEGAGKGKAAEAGKGGGGKGGEGKDKGKGGEDGGGKGEVGKEKGKGGGGDKAGGGANESSGGGGIEFNAICYHPTGNFCGPKCPQVCQGHCYPPCPSCSCRRECHQVCHGHCSPPCFTCSCKPERVWPQYPQPCANPDGVFCVLKEESYDPCTIM